MKTARQLTFVQYPKRWLRLLLSLEQPLHALQRQPLQEKVSP